MAAGMAKQGLIPVFAVYSTFFQRSYDMLMHDISIDHIHAVFGIDRAGLVGDDGETHHGLDGAGAGKRYHNYFSRYNMSLDRRRVHKAEKGRS